MATSANHITTVLFIRLKPFWEAARQEESTRAGTGTPGLRIEELRNGGGTARVYEPKVHRGSRESREDTILRQRGCDQSITHQHSIREFLNSSSRNYDIFFELVSEN